MNFNKATPSDNIRMCDDNGLVSDELITPSVAFNRTLTYLELLNYLRSQSGLSPYKGKPFRCSGSAHLAGMRIRCTSPTHAINQFRS